MNESQISHGAMRDKIQEAVSWTRTERFDEAIGVFEQYLAVRDSPRRHSPTTGSAWRWSDTNTRKP
jgi:hypothetical protein